MNCTNRFSLNRTPGRRGQAIVSRQRRTGVAEVPYTHPALHPWYW